MQLLATTICNKDDCVKNILIKEAAIIIIKATNKNVCKNLKSFFVVIANIEIAPNPIAVKKKACPTIIPPSGIFKVFAINGADVNPVINVNINNKSKFIPC